LTSVTDPERSVGVQRQIAGIPLRHVVMATAVALVAALAGVLLMLADPADTPGTESTLSLEPADEVLGAPVAADFETFDGQRANTGSYVGQPLVLNFFAEWCAPCVAEMPDFETVYQEVGDEVAFLGLSYLEGAEAGLRLVERTGVTYDVARDTDGSALSAFGAIGMPTTVFIDATGTVREVHTGALTADELRERIDRHLR
jgi:cytochrome c biogenesis protein CcmG, thiol:disulfide interchange protein DsbE